MMNSQACALPNHEQRPSVCHAYAAQRRCGSSSSLPPGRESMPPSMWLSTQGGDCLTAASEGLAFLAAHLLVLVTDTFALVRLRLADRPHLGGELAHLLLVRAADDDG